jgi:hypothetical protein
VSNQRGVHTKWRDDERGDADSDGLLEFHDAWGQPIVWLRWPAGYPGAEDIPIGFDPSAVPALRSLGPQPIIMSAGRDGIYDVNRGTEGDGVTYHYRLDGFGNINPWTEDEHIPSHLIGEPVDATAPNGDAADGNLNHHDNLTSWDRPA